MIYKPEYVEIELEILRKAVMANLPIEEVIKLEEKFDIELQEVGKN